MTPGVDVTGGVCRNNARVDVTGGVCRNDAGVDVTAACAGMTPGWT